MTVAVPVEQYRKSYLFLTPETYDKSYVNVTAPAGAKITLDGVDIDPMLFKPVGSGGYMSSRVEVMPGAHSITGSAPIGITVYGMAPFTSYMYPGGLDVKQINIQ